MTTNPAERNARPLDVIRERHLDAIAAFQHCFTSPHSGAQRLRKMPPAHRRVAIALLAAMQADAEERQLISNTDAMANLSPRLAAYDKRPLQKDIVKSDQYFASLDWLRAEGVIECVAYSQRRQAHWVRFTLDWQAAPKPAFEHARANTMDAVTLKRATPAQLAIIEGLSYAARADGTTCPLTASEVDAVIGMSLRQVLIHLESDSIGPELGLLRWELDRTQSPARLCALLGKADDSEVLAQPRPRLHPSFVADALAAGNGTPPAGAPLKLTDEKREQVFIRRVISDGSDTIAHELPICAPAQDSEPMSGAEVFVRLNLAQTIVEPMCQAWLDGDTRRFELQRGELWEHCGHALGRRYGDGEGALAFLRQSLAQELAGWNDFRRNHGFEVVAMPTDLQLCPSTSVPSR